jgi:hypothetical protein
VSPEQAVVLVKNLLGRPLRYLVKSDCRLFEVEVPISTKIADRGSEQVLLVKVNSDVLRDSQFLLAGEKYIEEHFTIYNADNLKEKYWIVLRFSRGSMQQFFPNPGLRSGIQFSMLEQRIMRFLHRVHSQLMQKMTSFGASTAVACENVDVAPSHQSEAIGQVVSGQSDNARPHIAFYNWLASDQDMNALYFELRFITDELVFYGLKGKVGRIFMHLAALTFSSLAKSLLFSPFLSSEGELLVPVHELPDIVKKWGRQMLFFLKWFPDEREHFGDKSTVRFCKSLGLQD